MSTAEKRIQIRTLSPDELRQIRSLTYDGFTEVQIERALSSISHVIVDRRTGNVALHRFRLAPETLEGISGRTGREPKLPCFIIYSSDRQVMVRECERLNRERGDHHEVRAMTGRELQAIQGVQGLAVLSGQAHHHPHVLGISQESLRFLAIEGLPDLVGNFVGNAGGLETLEELHS